MHGRQAENEARACVGNTRRLKWKRIKPEISERKRQRKFREEEAGIIQDEMFLEGSGHTPCRVRFWKVNSMNKETESSPGALMAD